MDPHDRGGKRPWSRERWLLALLTPVYVALVAHCLAAGGFADEPVVRTIGMPRAISRFELNLPTSRPELATPVPTQTPPGVHRKLDINQADAWMLTAVPGIGQALADRIVAYRDAQGGLLVIEELNRVEGIGERLFGTLTEYVEVR